MKRYKDRRVMESFNRLPPELAGVLMAMVIAVIRVIYDKEDARPVRVMLEAFICGGLSLTASSAIIAMELDVNWAIFAGGTIGYFGSATVRQFALKLLRRKID